jgi:hypothetical protein
MPNDLAVLMAGFDRMEGHLTDSGGIIAGTTGTVASGAVGSPGFRVLAGKDAPNVGVPDADAIPITGDDDYQGGFIFPSAAVRRFIHTAAVLGLDINAIMNGSTAYAVGNSEVGFLDASPFTVLSMALILTSQAKSAQGADQGQGLFSGYIIPQIQGVPLGRQTLQERIAGISRIGFIESKASQFPWGETFTLGVHKITQAVLIPWISQYRKAFHRFTGDGATTVFGPLLYQPATTSLLDVVVYVNGYKQTSGITVQQGAQTITFAPAPATNAKIVVYYDHL